MRTKFARFYAHFYVIDALIGVFLTVTGFLSPESYIRLLLSIPSALESYAFLALTVIFTVHVWWAKLPRLLYALPGYIGLMTVLIQSYFGFLHSRIRQEGAVLSDTQEMGLQLEVLKAPEYLTLALLASVVGFTLGVWILIKLAKKPKRLSRSPALRNRRFPS